MTLNRVKLERAVSFIKYNASLVSLLFQSKTLIWNKMVLPTSNLLKVLEHPVQSVPLRYATMAFPIDNLAESASPDSHYASPANKWKSSLP